MSSIFSTQNRQTFLRRKYCFLVAIALSPPVGRIEALMGRPPLGDSAIFAPYSFSAPTGVSTGADATGAVGAPGMGAPGVRPPAAGAPGIAAPGSDGMA